jgi:hypothetical protein
MSDPRWSDVDADINDALMHLGMALKIFGAGGFQDPDVEGYKSSGSFMHGMTAGYTSLENALKRILDILNETPPAGTDRWHKDLIDRISRPMAGGNARPALVDEEMKQDLLECMRMRHRVRHSDYGEFVPSKAEPAVEAAGRITARVRDVVARFKRAVDPEPDENNDGGDGAGGGAAGGPP